MKFPPEVRHLMDRKANCPEPGVHEKGTGYLFHNIFWLNFGVLIGYAEIWQIVPKKDEKVSFHAQNWQKSNPTCIGLVPCTETGQNEVSKQTTEEVQGVILVFWFLTIKKILGQQ
jgi:hypothetical protein